MVNLLEDPVMEEVLPVEEEAVRVQQRIESLKLELEELQARRDELVERSIKAGIRDYGGYRFIEKKPADMMSETAFADNYGQLFDGYIAWSKERAEVKVTKKGVTDFLKAQGHEDPSEVIAAITVAGKGAPTYGMQRCRE